MKGEPNGVFGGILEGSGFLQCIGVTLANLNNIAASLL